MEDLKFLMETAEEARKLAYCPYSHFSVGAAVLTKSNKMYIGCNIENASFGAGICAERTAIFKAFSEGEREFEAIAITGGKEGEDGHFCAPCGICRQVLSELGGDDLKVLLGSAEQYETYTLGSLFPFAFTKNNLS